MALLCSASIAADSVKSNEEGNAGLLLRWVDATGKIFPGTKVTKMSWVWNKPRSIDTMESPALRVRIQSSLPADWVPKKITASGLTVAEPYKPGPIQSMVIDLRSGKSVLRITFADSKGSLIEMTLLVRVTVVRPFILLRPECKKQELAFVVNKAESQHLFVGLNCVDNGDSYDIYFFRSLDSKWHHAPGLVRFDPQNKYTAFKHRVEKPKTQIAYAQRLFQVGTADEQGKPSEFSVYYDPKTPPKRLYLSAGLGVTDYFYKEKFGNLEINQVSLTGKVNAGYRLIPRVLDIAFNFFGNIVSLYHNPTSTSGADYPAARYYGINGRLGYRLPLGMGANELFFLTGWYVWNMSVPATSEDTLYGISNLSGPQLFLALVHSQANHAGWAVYFKYAFIADRFQLLSTGREIAAGGNIELSKRESKPFAITLDVAHAKFSNEVNSLELLSITAGIQRAI